MPSKKKIIIVDDSPLFRLNTKSILSDRYDLEILEASSIREMYIFLLNNPKEDIALIILDINLPDGNGLIALHTYKEKHSIDYLPYIVVSTSLSKDILPLALKYGALDILIKPVNLKDFVNRIDKILKEPVRHYGKSRSVTDFYEPIRKEIKRAHRGNYPFSILMLSLQALEKEGASLEEQNQEVDIQKKLSNRIDSVLRETDEVVELTPGDLLLFLPFTNHKGVPAVEEKVQHEVFPREEDSKEAVLIVSSVTFPEHGENPDQLIAKLEEKFTEQSALINEA